MPLLRQLASGLTAAHQAGVIHGDLKPSNIFLEDLSRPQGTIRAVITDFGLAVPALGFAASSLPTFSTLRMGDRICGTPAYMAPEQLQGQRATVASDVYAFGLVAYEILTGTRACAEENIPLLMNSILTGKPKTPSSLNANLPAKFDLVVLKALEKHPSDRYQSVDQFVETLEGQTLDATENSRLAFTRDGSGWKRSRAIVMFVVLILIIISGYRSHRSAGVSQSQMKLPQTVLAFSIVAQHYHDGKPNGQPYAVSDEKPFYSGMGIKLILSSSQPGYLYILDEAPASTDLAPLFNIIFPSPFIQGGSTRVEPGRDLTIPENGSLLFDEHKGAEKVWIVWSNQRLNELESLKRWANEHDRGRIGDFTEALRIKSFLESSKLSLPQVSRDSVNGISLASSRDILVYPLRLNHIERTETD